MKSDELKAKIQKNVKEEVAISNLKEEIYMEHSKNKKLFYGVLSSCAMLAICVGIVITQIPKSKQENIWIAKNLANQAKVEELKESVQKTMDIEINVNEVNSLTGLDYAIDGRRTKIDAQMATADLVYGINVKLPEDIRGPLCYGLYVKGKNVKKYDVLHSYEFYYRNEDETRNITIGLGFNGNKPLRDYYMSEVEKKSKIGEVEIEITKYEDLYLVLFSHKGVNFDVETKGITQEELVEFLKSVICDNTTYPGMQVDDQDISTSNIPTENSNTNYPDFYAGNYIDENRNTVVLLCNDSEENQNEICKTLGIDKNKAIFKTASHSLSYLNELQNKISKEMQAKNLPSVTSSSVRIEENKIRVMVTSRDDIEKIKALDITGTALEITQNKNGVVTHELVESK